MYYAKQQELSKGETPKQLLWELDSVGKAYWNRDADHWTNHMAASWGVQGGWLNNTKMNFETYAIAFGLEIFAREFLEKRSASEIRNHPSYLYAALSPTVSHPLLTGKQFPHVAMIRMLLQHGVDSNQVIRFYDHSITVWQSFLRAIINADMGSGLLPHRLEVAKLFLKNGADPRTKFKLKDGSNELVCARECPRFACPRSEFETFGEVFDDALSKSNSAQTNLPWKTTSSDEWHASVDLKFQGGIRPSEALRSNWRTAFDNPVAR